MPYFEYVPNDCNYNKMPDDWTQLTSLSICCAAAIVTFKPV